LKVIEGLFKMIFSWDFLRALNAPAVSQRGT